MTDKLDSEWRELLPVIKTLKKSDEDKEMRQPDEYDKLVKEMIFSPRAEPAEKLKSEEEVARLEKEKLNKLERERLARMRDDEDDGVKKVKHKSADDLDDGYFLEEPQEEEEGTLAYDLNPKEDEDEDEICEEEENDENQQESENQQVDNEQDESDSDEESEVDSLDDLKEDENSSENDQEVDDEEESSSEDESEPSSPAKEVKSASIESQKLDKNADILKTIPYTIQMPTSYENLEKLLASHPIAVQTTIVDRIIKTNHPKLLHANKAKMLKLFAYLLQLINDKFSSVDSSELLSSNFKLLQSLAPHLYELVHMNPADASSCYLEVMKEKYEDFKKNPKNFPQLDTLVFFEVLGKLFPTSDFRHTVVTPVYIFMHHIFSQSRVKTRAELARGLFLATIVLDYQQLSKKFMPAVLNFLMGINYLGSERDVTKNDKPIPPFKRTEPLLVISEEFEEDFDVASKLQGDDFLQDEIDDDFRARALNVNCQLIRDYMKLYEDHVGVQYLVDFQLKHLKDVVQTKLLPTSLKTSIETLIEDFEDLKSTKKFVFPQPDKKATPMLRLLEPQFETVLSDRRSMYAEARGGRVEEKKLQHMVKREFKAAKRELRRDNEFISKIRFKQRQEQDRERQAKVKRIFNDASIQQSEYKKMQNKKKRF